MLSTDDLNRKMFKLLPNSYQGTIPLDYLPSIKLTDSKKDICTIFNSQPSSMTGEHWMSIYLPAKRDKIIFIDPQNLYEFKFNRVIRNCLSQSFRSVLEVLPYTIQGMNFSCGLFNAYILCHLKNFDYNLNHLIGSIFSESDLILNNEIVKNWWYNLI